MFGPSPISLIYHSKRSFTDDFILKLSWSWAEVYVMGERGTMMRLGLTFILSTENLR